MQTPVPALFLSCLWLSASTPVGVQDAAPPPVTAVQRGVEPVRAPPVAGAMAGPFPAQVLQVIDGDTIEVRVTIWLGQEVTTRVRLRGIDAAEMAGRCAEETQMAQAAKHALIRYADARSVLLTEVGKDKYGGRVLARVLLATGEDVSQLMLAAQRARPYEGGRRQSWCGPELTSRR